MALAGNLRDFGVPDILQLIMTQEKTGVLTIKSDSSVGNIGFEKGMIVEATYGGVSRDQLLKDYFEKAGRLSPGEVQEILRHQAETGSSFEAILLKFGFVSERELKDIVNFRIQEVVDILLTWKEGEYRFDIEATIYPKGVVQVSVNPQAVMMEGMRRIDEWPRIQKVLPDPNIILMKRPKPILSVQFGPEEKRVMEFADGTRSLAQLQDVTGLGKFRTYQACFNLLEVGALEKKGLAVVAPAPPKKKGISPGEVKGLVFGGIGWAVLGVFIIANVCAGLYLRSYAGKMVKPVPQVEVTSAEVNGIGVLLDQFLLKKGHYPESLDELVQESWATPQVIAGLDYHRADSGTSYTLTPEPTPKQGFKLPF
jgi:hypothetical protein